MLAAFWWEQPDWLVLVLAGSSALAAWRRGQSLAGAGALAAGAGVAAAALGMLLLRAGTSAAAVLLAMLALLAAAWLTVSAARGAGTRISPPRRLLLVFIRTAAWLMLLVLLARPAWDRVVVTWRRPLLVVLLDQSESMGLADAVPPATAVPRAERVNRALSALRSATGRLERTYDVRLRGVGIESRPLDGWAIAPAERASGLAAALRDAALLRSADGRPASAVLLVSDGAENVDGPAAVRKAAAELGTQGSPLLAVGVGPAAGTTPQVELDPLALPPRIAPREHLRFSLTGRAHGCAGAFLAVEILADAAPLDSRPVPVDHDNQHVRVLFDLLPPGPGLHRITARVALPASLGGLVVQTSTIVEVGESTLRVLWLADVPRAESAFVARILDSEPDMELTRRFLATEESGPRTPLDWSADVIVLESAPLAAQGGFADLLNAVGDGGAGLLLAGGRRLLNEDRQAAEKLAALAPAALVRDEFGIAGPLQFVPTRAGMAHPVLQGLAASAQVATQPDERAAWLKLPPLGGAARVGDPKPAAEVLARDGAGRPLLLAQEVGRGRCILAAWESTWPWALASDEGAALHRRLWRQMINWLANRRPRAWVITDEPQYPLQAVVGARRAVQIRAGASAPGGAGLEGLSDPRLEFVTPEGKRPVRLERRGGEWRAELPAGLRGEPITSPGEYALEFSVSESAAGGETRRLEARTAFALVEAQLELQPPTANLALLRSAAEQNAAPGGGFWSIEQFADVLNKLAATDRGEEVRTQVPHVLAERRPGTLVLLLITLLGLEWAVRKAGGLP